MVKRARRVTNFLKISAFTGGLLFTLASAAFSQTTTLRNPLVPGAFTAAPESTPVPGAVPPPGSDTYMPVTPGMSGSPGFEPWVTTIPSNTAGVTDSNVQLPLQPSDTTAPGMFRQDVYASIPPSPSTPGTDPGLLPPTLAGYQPPAANVQLAPDGSMPGDDAPKQKWGGQTSKDYGRNILKAQDSRLYDFGLKLSKNPAVAKQPQYSQDGPRPFQIPQDYTTPSRQPQLTNSYGPAQETTDVGYRTLFDGSTRALQTQANY